MQKGKLFVNIWRDLKRAKEISIAVHAEDVARYKGNIIKNKTRDVAYSILFPSARLSFEYDEQSTILTVRLFITQLDSIPINKL